MDHVKLSNNLKLGRLRPTQPDEVPQGEKWNSSLGSQARVSRAPRNQIGKNSAANGRVFYPTVTTMCVEVCYHLNGKTIITHFANPRAKLPVKTQTGETKLIPWGRRKGETGMLPLGGWASLESINKGWWDIHFPKMVKLPIAKFMEQDFEIRSDWFDVTTGFWIQGLLLQQNTEQRVYIVTILPELPDNTYGRWPRILAD